MRDVGAAAPCTPSAPASGTARYATPRNGGAEGVTPPPRPRPSPPIPTTTAVSTAAAPTLGCRVEVWLLGCWIVGLLGRCVVEMLNCWIVGSGALGLGAGFLGFGIWVWGFRIRVLDIGFSVWYSDFEFWVRGLGVHFLGLWRVGGGGGGQHLGIVWCREPLPEWASVSPRAAVEREGNDLTLT